MEHRDWAFASRCPLNSCLGERGSSPLAATDHVLGSGHVIGWVDHNAYPVLFRIDVCPPCRKDCPRAWASKNFASLLPLRSTCSYWSSCFWHGAGRTFDV